MDPRTRTLAAIGAAVATAGLVIGISFVGSSAATGSTQPTPPTASMSMSQMPGMGSMMTGDMSAMHSLMGSAGMSAMHSMMHRMMKGTVADDVLAECDKAHAAMAGSVATNTERIETRHELHHEGTES